MRFETGLATLQFNGFSRFGAREQITVVGSQGTLQASGPFVELIGVELHSDAGHSVAELTGAWFPDGFRGTMGELLCAIEEDREPENSAAANLKSLAVCLGAMQSVDERRVVGVDFLKTANLS